MDGEMDDNALLKYVRFQILPSQNRYKTFASNGNKDELLFEGVLEQLTQHLPQVKDFYLGGSEANVKLQWPTNSGAAAWFSKSTLRRFLNIAVSRELFNEIEAFEDEMSQLEKARKFHISLYSQSESEVETISSDPSKNELLRAMDSRLKALREELATVLEQAAGSFCSSKDVSHMVNCSHALSAMVLKKYLIKFSELNQITLVLENSSDEKPTMVNVDGCDDETGAEPNGGISKSSKPVVLVQYNGSPAKVAEAERDNTTDSEDSSDDSRDVDATERCRSIMRSATPKRSASPMRRVQIARVGSRRATAIGVKSLNYFPVRERTFDSRNDEPANSSGEEVSEKVPRKPETNVQRMSVQAAISLFESRQREENADVQKMSLGDVSKNVKPVLRKWNSCIEQSHAQCSTEAIADDHSFKSAANRPEIDATVVDISHQVGEVDAAPQTPNSHESSTLNPKGNDMATQLEESTERRTAVAKWNQQKEAELGMLMKMMEGKPVKHGGSGITNKNNTSEQRGGFYDDYRKKRDEKLRGENAARRGEKESQFKAMQQITEKSKVDMSSKHGRRQSLPKPVTSAAQPQSVNPKKELPKDSKPTNVKRGAMKPSSLPATRKSWPSTQPQQATGTSPLANSCIKVTPTATTRCKSQLPQSLARPKPPKAEKPLLHKNAKGLQTESRTNSNGAKAMHRQPWARDTKPTKPKSLASCEDFSDMIPEKTELHSKWAKQSSVAPVKSQPFLRKGSKVSSVVLTVTKIKTSPRSNESVRKSRITPCSQEKEEAVQSPEQVDKHEIENRQSEPALVSEILFINDHKTMDVETSSNDSADAFGNLAVIEDSSLKFEKEETTISPGRWVEVEESHDLPIPIDDSQVEFAYSTSVAVESASLQRRQSLSQMLQEESNELDNTEWGNTENPTVFYPKDVPKGFKRLLKFARKRYS
ncbi:unnamed protein product [Rhodiola kirilowii]